LALWTISTRLPELVLLDIRMPGINGIEVCRQLKADPATSALPVIFLSALSDAEDKVEGFAVGAADYIGKPYNPNEVLARVNTHMRLAQLSRAQELAMAELRATQKKLVQAEKLASLGTLVTAVAHELNTPIGVCLTTASTLEERTRDFEANVEKGNLRRTQLNEFLTDSREGMVLIQRGLARCANLIDSFKTAAAGGSSMQRRRFDLLRESTELQGNINSGMSATPYHLELDIPAGLEMESYPEAIARIVSQLADNALTHGFAGREYGTMSMRARLEDGWLQLSFHDDGVGMSEETQRHIFDPFYTTHLGQGSNGLGMYICHNMATGALGGDIEVVSAPGQGCTVTLRIPQTAPHPEAS
jgi:signal transduction histidine kinase